MKLTEILNEVANEKKAESRVVSIRLTVEETKGLDQLCQKKGTTINKVLKRLIQNALKEGVK